MRKSALLLIVLLSLILATACTNPAQKEGGSSANPYSPDALPSSNGTTPASPTTSKAIYLDATLSLESAMMSSQSSPKTILKKTTPISESLSWTGTYGGGTVNVSGKVSGSSTTPDSAPGANASYRDLMKILVDMAISGNVDGITVSSTTDSTVTYKISGKLAEAMNMDFSVDATTNAKAEPQSMSYDLSLSMQYSIAYSILRNDGVGAKFILTYSGSSNQTAVPVAIDLSAAGSVNPTSQMINDLSATKAQLYVYDDNNKLVHSAELGLDDIMNSFDF